MPRLSTQTLELVQPDVARPAYDFQRTGIGHVHFGVGAFMRAFVTAMGFSAGGHGFSLRFTIGKPVSIWPELFVRWSQSMGLIQE